MLKLLANLLFKYPCFDVMAVFKLLSVWRKPVIKSVIKKYVDYPVPINNDK